MKLLLYTLFMTIVLYSMIQGIRCTQGLRKAREKLDSYEVKTAELSYGSMTYIDKGEGEVILSVHAFSEDTIRLMTMFKTEPV